MNTENLEIIEFTYIFSFENGRSANFKIQIEPKTLTIINSIKKTPPAWTTMQEFQCPNCPLDPAEYKYCPVAVNLRDIIVFFSDIPSYYNSEVKVLSKERTYIKETMVQDGVGSMLGVILPVSGCPVLGKLKPLVSTHLPFANIEETEIRVFTGYLFAQYLKYLDGNEPDWNLTGLKSIYDNIRTVNQNIARKIADLEAHDTSINAVVVLNNFAETVAFSIDEKEMTSYRKIFEGWF